MTNCVFCHGRSNKGAHDICWKEFKGFMLSDRVSFGTGQWDETYDDARASDPNHRNASDRNIVDGLVSKTKLGND